VKILVVDDDPAVSAAQDRALRLDGYQVATVPDGSMALQALALAPPDSVVLDLGLPGIDGLDVCRRMRMAGDDTPVLMLTARDFVANRVLGHDAGADSDRNPVVDTGHAAPRPGRSRPGIPVILGRRRGRGAARHNRYVDGLHASGNGTRW
jgi:CheY-like chemotaxis protein